MNKKYNIYLFFSFLGWEKSIVSNKRVVKIGELRKKMLPFGRLNLFASVNFL